MKSADPKDKRTYKQFRQEWVAEIEDAELSPLGKGIQFAVKLVSQWLDVTTDDDDFVICDGSGDGGIDIAYLQRADGSSEEQRNSTETTEGDTWYIVQSKYGTAFTGSDTISQEGHKILRTLEGANQNLSDVSRQLLEKLNQFRQQASDTDRIVLVFATVDPITQRDRQELENIKIIGRERIIPKFDVEDISLQTIWEALDEIEQHKQSVPLQGQFVEQYSGLLVGTVPLTQLFEFLDSYRKKTGNLDQIYERNVRKFLGNRRKINKGIAETLNENPEKFGLYNNGITIVVSSYERDSGDGTIYNVNDPYIVNGCQTTKTIWEVLDGKLNAGGTGSDESTESWKERVRRGGVVTKIVTSNEAELLNITRFTNSQNSVREQDFIALHRGFKDWAAAMAGDYKIFLEIQRGGTESQKAWEKQHPQAAEPFDDYVNAFDLVKVYGAGWLRVPGLAYSKNPPFLPGGPVYEKMVSRESKEPAFGARDLYAAYKIKCAADKIGFGRNANPPSRRQSRFLFYHAIMRILHNIIQLTTELGQPSAPPSALTDAVIKLGPAEAKAQFDMLCNSAVGLIDQYLTYGNNNSAYKEKSFTEIHNGDLNGFLKSEYLGKESHSPLLVQLLEIHKMSFGSIPMPMYEGNPTQREFVAQALL